MATTTSKKTTTKKTTSTSAKGSSRGGSRSGKNTQPEKRPIRREVWGIVLLVLTLCVGVSYFGISALFIDWFAMLLKGLLGYGYWLAGPALLLSAMILLFHHAWPVTLRVTCSLMLPVLFGALGHMVLCGETYSASPTILTYLWSDGVAMESGGALAGLLAEGSVAVFSKIASIILFTALFAVLAMVALRLTVGAIIEKSRNRPR